MNGKRLIMVFASGFKQLIGLLEAQKDFVSQRGKSLFADASVPLILDMVIEH